MKHLIVSLLVLTLCFIMASPINPQDKEKKKVIKIQEDGAAVALVEKEIVIQKETANKQLGRLKKFSRKFYKALGFKSKMELQQSSLGKPYKIYMIVIQDIKLITEEHDPSKILIDLKKQIYPVYVGTKLKTSVSIKKRKDKKEKEKMWKPSSIGKREIHALEPARKKYLESADKNLPLFVVRIPAMYIVFLGYYNKRNELYLIQTHKHPYIKFDLYKPIPAQEVFLQLKPYVPKYEKAFKPIKIDKSKNTPRPVKKVKKNN